MHRNTAKIITKLYFSIEKICLSKMYPTIIRPFFCVACKQKKQVENTYELYTTNWSYSYKLGIFSAIYQGMISKGASWDGTRLKHDGHLFTSRKVMLTLLMNHNKALKGIPGEANTITAVLLQV